MGDTPHLAVQSVYKAPIHPKRKLQPWIPNTKYLTLYKIISEGAFCWHQLLLCSLVDHGLAFFHGVSTYYSLSYAVNCFSLLNGQFGKETCTVFIVGEDMTNNQWTQIRNIDIYICVYFLQRSKPNSANIRHLFYNIEVQPQALLQKLP